MAATWIPMRMDLLDDPAVIQIAAAVGLDEYAVAGRLLRLWAWANQQLSNGNAPGVTLAWLDRYVGASGFAAAMVEAGWLVVEKFGVSFPNFDRWNSQGAKKRVLATQRVQRSRVVKCNAPGVTEALPEKRREEKKEEEPPPTPPKPGGRARADRSGLGSPLFERFWEAYPRKVGKTEAAKAFAKLAPDDALLGVVLAAVHDQRGWEQWRKDDGRFIPHPATWLNGRRWEDEPPMATGPPPERRGLLSHDDRVLEQISDLFDPEEPP